MTDLSSLSKIKLSQGMWWKQLLHYWLFFNSLKKLKASVWSDILGDFTHCSTLYVQCVDVLETSLLGNACEVSPTRKVGDSFVGELH